MQRSGEPWKRGVSENVSEMSHARKSERTSREHTANTPEWQPKSLRLGWKWLRVAKDSTLELGADFHFWNGNLALEMESGLGKKETAKPVNTWQVCQKCWREETTTERSCISNCHLKAAAREIIKLRQAGKWKVAQPWSQSKGVGIHRWHWLPGICS